MSFKVGDRVRLKPGAYLTNLHGLGYECSYSISEVSEAGISLVGSGCIWNPEYFFLISRDETINSSEDFKKINKPRLEEKKSALDVQEGGGHYKSKGIQPVEYAYRNNLGFIESNVVKYVSRWKEKNGIQDLKKARHYLDILIEFEEKK